MALGMLLGMGYLLIPSGGSKDDDRLRFGLLDALFFFFFLGGAGLICLSQVLAR